MSDIEIRQQHAIAIQRQAIGLGAAYGALAFAGLIVLGVVLDTPLASLSAIAGAFLAYLNFTLIASGARAHWVTATMVLSIMAGVASAVLLLGAL
mgnify:CR=1 FL=1